MVDWQWLDMPHIPGNGPTGRQFSPSGIGQHRTIGRWGGDLSVLTRGLVPSVQFLVGQDYGQWAQLYPLNMVCYHFAGGNFAKAGIENSGQNGEDLTEWQILANIRITQMCEPFIGPQVYDWWEDHFGNTRSKFDIADWPGSVNHRNVLAGGDEHTDFIWEDEWHRIVAGARGGLPAPAPGSPPVKIQRKDNKMFVCWLLYGNPGGWVDVYYNGVQVDSFANEGGSPDTFGIGPKLKALIDQGVYVRGVANKDEYEKGAFGQPGLRDRILASGK